MIRLYGIRNCDQCRAAAAWLSKHAVAHEFIDLRADGFDSDDLRRWQAAAGWEALLNKRSITWRKIPAIDRSGLDADSAAALIQEHPTVMRRPLLEYNGQVLLGFDPAAYAELTGSN